MEAREVDLRVLNKIARKQIQGLGMIFHVFMLAKCLSEFSNN